MEFVRFIMSGLLKYSVMVKEEEVAEFVGIMIGDGSIGIYNTKAGNRIKIHRRVKVTLDSRNIGYINHVSKVMKNVLDITPRLFFKKKENAVDISTHRKDKIDFVTNTIGLKASPKWGRMEIPEKYSRGRYGLLVLKGLFDTDGCLTIFNNNGNTYPRIEIRLSPSPAQNQVSNILEEQGFNYKIQELERGKTKVRISGVKELKRWFDLIGSSNPIHLEKSRRFLNS